MCRTIRMHPTDYVTIGHMKGLTFLPDANLFDYEAPENECYCPAKVTGSCWFILNILNFTSNTDDPTVPFIHPKCLTKYRVLHIYWTAFKDSPFLSQLTQEKVMHFFRKPWILADESNYETKMKYVMGGSRRVLVKLVRFCFLHWILITCHF